MAENTNCWAFLHKPLVDAWEAWWEWYKQQFDPVTGDPISEPELDGWDKSRILTMIHQDFAFHAYDPPQMWDGREWRMLNFYNISRGNITAGIALHGDAFAGGDFNALGYWVWESRDDPFSQKIPQIEYRPDIAILFMPPECVVFDQASGECLQYEPATEVTDVNLAAGQPPRDLTEGLNLVAIVNHLQSEGWEVKNLGGKRIRIVYNGVKYDRLIDYLLGCDFSDIPAPLADDIRDALNAQGLCQ